MDTFVDSSWYFLRYLDNENTEKPFEPTVVNQWMPVDLYIGGLEHGNKRLHVCFFPDFTVDDNRFAFFLCFSLFSWLALTHLFVARFIQHFMHSKGLCTSQEPFKRFIPIGKTISLVNEASAQRVLLFLPGMVQGKTFKTASGQYVSKENALAIDKHKNVHASTKEPLVIEWEKMSKSKYNGVDPQDIIDRYGVDFTRILMLNFVHPRSQRNFTRKCCSLISHTCHVEGWMAQVTCILRLWVPEVNSGAHAPQSRKHRCLLTKTLLHYEID